MQHTEEIRQNKTHFDMMIADLKENTWIGPRAGRKYRWDALATRYQLSSLTDFVHRSTCAKKIHLAKHTE